jgi:hypothetical protein
MRPVKKGSVIDMAHDAVALLAKGNQDEKDGCIRCTFNRRWWSTVAVKCSSEVQCEHRRALSRVSKQALRLSDHGCMEIVDLGISSCVHMLR